MSRYIDADAALSRLPDDLPYKASVKRVLIQAPTADVVEVRHGEWIVCGTFDDFLKCSLCESEKYPMSQVGNYKYCPNCGAKMSGERKTDDEG